MRVTPEGEARPSLPSPGLARLLAVLSAIVTMLLWGPLLVGLAFGVADSPGEGNTFEIVMFWWVFVAWPIASATAVACAVIMRRWPRVAAYLLVLVAAAMAFPIVVSGLIALAAALFSYLYDRASKPPVSPAMFGPESRLPDPSAVVDGRAPKEASDATGHAAHAARRPHRLRLRR